MLQNGALRIARSYAVDVDYGQTGMESSLHPRRWRLFRLCLERTNIRSMTRPSSAGRVANQEVFSL